MTKNQLIAGGCSNTDKNFSYNGISYVKWPEILANDLNLKPINLAQAGASNAEISFAIRDYLYRNHDKVNCVFVLWSCWSRVNMSYCKKGTSLPLLMRELDPPPTDPNRNMMHQYNDTDAYIDFLQHLRFGSSGEEDVDFYLSPIDWVEYNFNQIKQVEIACKYYNKPYLFMSGIGNNVDHSYSLFANRKKYNFDTFMLKSQYEITKNKLNIDKKNYIGWHSVEDYFEVKEVPEPGKKHNIKFDTLRYFCRVENHHLLTSREDGHPNYDGQKFISDLFLKFYKHNYVEH